MALPPPERLSSRHGCTLVEVSLALGIVAFAFVSLLALLPAGNTAFRRAMNISVCSQIAQRVIGDAQTAEFNTLTQSTSKGDDRPEGYTFRVPLRYFDEHGREILPAFGSALSETEKRHAIYHVNMRVMPRVPLPRNADRTTKQDINHLAGESKPLNSLAQLTVQVVHNPNTLKLEFNEEDISDINDPTRNLLSQDPKSKTSLDVFTYSAMVGRNN